MYVIKYRCDTAISETKVVLAQPQQSPAVQQIITYNLGLHRLLTEARATLAKCLEKANNNSTKDITLQEAERAVLNMAERSPLAVECVVVTALCSLNKRFLMMETAAKSKYKNVEINIKCPNYFKIILHLEQHTFVSCH